MAGKRGRPTSRTDQITQEIVDRISEGEPLAQICRDAHIPQIRTVYDWMESDESFSADIARARIAGYDMIAQDAMRIADSPITGEETEVDADGNVIKIKRSDMLGHRKLQIETRLKLLAKWDPKRYGDRVQTELSGSVSLPPLQVVIDRGDEAD